MNPNLPKPFVLAAAMLLLASCGGTEASSSGTSGTFPSSGGSEESSASSAEPVPEDENVHLVVLAGASGARGKVRNTDLTDEQSASYSDVPIMPYGYQMANLSVIDETLPSNVRFQSTAPGFGDTESESGPELGIAKELSARYGVDDYGENRSAILKITGSGSTLYDHWMSESSVADTTLDLNREAVVTNQELGEETGPMTNLLYQMIDRGIQYYEDLGYEVTLDGIVFMQGEQDAKFEADMAVYGEVLANLIGDVRDYVGDEDLPFVITGAVTNGSRYSNRLREIEEEVAGATGAIYVSAGDLYTNTFEAWHFGPSSNEMIGRRTASEIIAFRDNREVAGLVDATLAIPQNGAHCLPAYAEVTFTDGTTGLVPVNSYGEFDDSSLGAKQTTANFEYNAHSYSVDVTVNVTENPCVDGLIEEASYGEAMALGEKASIRLYGSDEGLYVAANVNDANINADGESWHTYDMGQMGENDDLRIYLTDGEAADRHSIYLSSASILRVYAKGYDASSLKLDMPANNLVYLGEADGFSYHVKTKGEVNDGPSEGMDMELFISYADLGIASAENLRILFEYSDVTLSGSGKTSVSSYLGNGTVTDQRENDLGNYCLLNSLI